MDLVRGEEGGRIGCRWLVGAVSLVPQAGACPPPFPAVVSVAATKLCPGTRAIFPSPDICLDAGGSDVLT
jgi:hypothetical protein